MGPTQICIIVCICIFEYLCICIYVCICVFMSLCICIQGVEEKYLATRFDKYIGEFSNGMFEGNGSYYFNDGSRWSLFWQLCSFKANFNCHVFHIWYLNGTFYRTDRDWIKMSLTFNVEVLRKFKKIKILFKICWEVQPRQKRWWWRNILQVGKIWEGSWILCSLCCAI